ncbi:MAG: rhomboid family intramembrane serine protease [Armatimonadota bacterium]|nr:rhomboid family intramembrane serine protease [Armatimonadota bacterium]
MRRQYSREDFAYFFRRGYIPTTKILMGVSIITAIVTLILGPMRSLDFVKLIAFSSSELVSKPWTLATYPLLTLCGPICLLFALLGLWFIGGSLERAWGTRVYTYFFFGISAIAALSLWAGATLAHTNIALLGLWMPIAAMLIAWASLNPEAEILIYFVIPVKAKFVALATVAGIIWNYRIEPILIPFALGGCFASWRYVQYRWRSPRSRPAVIRLRSRSLRWLNPLNWLKDRQERKRLRKLFGEDRRGGDDWNDRSRWR